MQLSGTQLIASALAATTATVAASYLGVAGTVIGAAVASILTVVGNAVYSQTIRRTGDRVRTVVPAVARFAPRPTATSPTAASPIPAAGTEPAPPSRQRNWKLLASACVGVFAAVLFVVTTVELIAGRPLSDVVQGKSGSGTSVLGDQHAKPVEPAPTPVHTPTVTVTPKVVTSTPTVTVIGPAVTKTAPPTATTTPTTPAPTPTPSSSPSGTVTSSGSATGTSSP